MVTDDSPVLLYDGECGFCAGSVQFVLRHEAPRRRGALRFAPLQGQFGASVKAAHAELAHADSVLWVEPGGPGHPPRVLTRSAASLSVLSHLGGVWHLLAVLGRVVPPILRDAVYNAIAARRFRIAAPACLLPTPEERQRFLP